MTPGARHHRLSYTSPTVELSCVASAMCGLLNSQPVHDDLVEQLKTEHVKNLCSRVGCIIGNWVTTADTPPDTTQLNSTCSVFFHFFYQIRRQSSCDSCKFKHTARRRRDSTRQLSRVGVGGEYWVLEFGLSQV